MTATKPPLGGSDVQLGATDGPGAAGWDVTWAEGEVPGAGDLDDVPTEDDETESLVTRVVRALHGARPCCAGLQAWGRRTFPLVMPPLPV